MHHLLPRTSLSFPFFLFFSAFFANAISAGESTTYKPTKNNLLREIAPLSVNQPLELRVVFRGARPVNADHVDRIDTLKGKPCVRLNRPGYSGLGDKIELVVPEPDASVKRALKSAEDGDTLILQGRLVQYAGNRFWFVVDTLRLAPLQGD